MPFLHYNFIRIHQTLRIIPGEVTGVTDHLHDFDWLLDMVDEAGREAPYFAIL